jgi:hypothetical protein
MIDKPYILYSKAGIEEVYCLNCGTTVRIRAAGVLTSRDGRKFDVSNVITLPNYRSGEKILIKTHNSKGYINPILCKDCIDKPIDKEGVLNKYKEDFLLNAKTEEEREKIKLMEIGE